MVCFSPVRFDVQLTFRALYLRRSNYTSNLTGEKHTISTLVDQTHIDKTYIAT